MLEQLARLTKQVLDIVRKEEVCRRLMSVPGVGPITALAFRATIDRPERFGRSRDVGAHLGLTPARYQSGETDIQGKVSRCGDELARTALYEAAHSLLVRSKKWSSLRAWGMNIAKRRGMARARVAVARKLAVILHRMWSDPTEFRFGKAAVAVLAALTVAAPDNEEKQHARTSPERVIRIVPVGTMGEAISLRVPNLQANARKVVRQIETPRSPDPIMRRPCADREEKRVTRGSDISGQDSEQEQLDLNDPNQRSLLERDDFSSSCHRALSLCLSMIFSENR